MKFPEFFSKAYFRIMTIVVVSLLVFLACEQKQITTGSSGKDYELLDNNNEVQSLSSQRNNQM